MITLAATIHHALLSAATSLTPDERWAGVNEYAANHRVDPWWVAFCVLTGLVLCVVALLGYRGYISAWNTRRRIRENARRSGLSEPEQQLIETLAQLSGLRHPEAVFTMSQAFDHAVASMMLLPRCQGMNDQARGQLADIIQALRTKLCFDNTPRSENSKIPSSRAIPAGSRLSVIHRGQVEGAEAIVEINDPMEMAVRPDPQMTARPGETLVLQYCQGMAAWEFTAPITAVRDGKLVLGHTSQVRYVNRRRFMRVPLRRPAKVGSLSFHGAAAGEMRMVDAELTEIAGPGVVMESPLHPLMGQRVVVAMQLRKEYGMQAPGIVRRVTDLHNGKFQIIVEMTDLNPQEVSELVRQTNLAMHEMTGVAITEEHSNG
ncbi:MAG: hypothetical protein ABFD92_05370 [Planctomycetaceae bacterium]|nr:hypothetical protein [Planctomycetaceae bacterium]